MNSRVHLHVTIDRPTGRRAADVGKEAKTTMLEKCEEVKHTIQVETNKAAAYKSAV